MNLIKIVISFTIIIGMNCFHCSADECDGNSAKSHARKLFDDLRVINKDIGLCIDDSCLDKELTDTSQIEYFFQTCGIGNGSDFINTLKDMGLYDSDPNVKKKVDEHIAYFRKYLKHCKWYDNMLN